MTTARQNDLFADLQATIARGAYRDRAYQMAAGLIAGCDHRAPTRIRAGTTGSELVAEWFDPSGVGVEVRMDGRTCKYTVTQLSGALFYRRDYTRFVTDDAGEAALRAQLYALAPVVETETVTIHP